MPTVETRWRCARSRLSPHRPPSASAVLGAASRTAPRVVAAWRLVAAAALLAAALVGALVAVGAWNARPTLVETVPVPSPSAASTPEPTLDASLPSPAPSSLAVAAQVGATCDGSLATIATPTVQAQADGVHLLVENTSGQPLDFGIEDGTGLALEGDSVPGASGTYTYDLATGHVSVRLQCIDRPVHRGRPGRALRLAPTVLRDAGVGHDQQH